MSKEKELRQSIRAELKEESRTVSGYACLFEKDSGDLGGFTEIISRGALDGVIDKSDILALLNHRSTNGVLARCRNGKGSLSLSVDSTGLRYEFEAPNTALGNELIESLKRGDITESSFAFTVENEEWTKHPDGRYTRRINKFERLYDVSPVYFPAYEGTTVGVRSADAILGEVRKKEQEKREEKERFEAYTKELDNYYKP